MKLTHNGRPFDANRFAVELEAKVIEAGIQSIEERARGVASAITDPATGRHADVFVDRLPGNRVAIRTSGSPEFARLLELRLGVGRGEVTTMSPGEPTTGPKVYLAHASEDKVLVRPIADYLMAKGIDVWFDEWEIEPGDSLRQKMEEGLLAMTHFVVVLTPKSITKPWVAKEIDVGMVGQVGGKNRLVPLVVGFEPSELSPFFPAMLVLKVDPTKEADLKALADRLFDVGRKPPLGQAPKYVQSAPAGLSGWSPAAIAVARHLAESSQHAMPHDPIVTAEDLAVALDLSLDDARLGVLDLVDGGYLWEASLPGHVGPKAAFFAEFDEAFMAFDPAEDARTVANQMVTAGERVSDTRELAQALGWEPRRMNSAICYLQSVGAIEARNALASNPWRAIHLLKTDRTLRFARNQA